MLLNDQFEGLECKQGACMYPVPVTEFDFVVWMYRENTIPHPPEKVVNLIEKKNTSGTYFSFKFLLYQ